MMLALYLSVVARRQLNQKLKFSGKWFIHIPSIINGHKYWVVNKRIRSWIQVPELSFPRRVSKLTLRDIGWEIW